MADTKEIIDCPICKIPMQKIFIEETGFYLDICNICGSILFDNQELKRTAKTKNSINKLSKLKNIQQQDKDETKQIICPVCSAKMVKNKIALNNKTKTIKIDECYTCGAFFLNYSQLELIYNSIKKQNTNENSNKNDKISLKNSAQNYDKKYIKELIDIRKKEEVNKRLIWIFEILFYNSSWRYMSFYPKDPAFFSEY